MDSHTIENTSQICFPVNIWVIVSQTGGGGGGAERRLLIKSEDEILLFAAELKIKHQLKFN